MTLRACIGAVLASVLSVSAMTATQPDCPLPLSAQEIAAIVAKAREVQKDLPEPFADVEVVLRKEGCHYLYIEYSLPRTPHVQNIFRLNRNGVIVDVEPGSVACPDRTLSEAELAEVVRAARASRPDLPAAYPETRVRVDRRRCLYLYFEYAVPERPGNFQVFTIDPFGEVVEGRRMKKY